MNIKLPVLNSGLTQILIYLFVNVLFIAKYTARTSYSPILVSACFISMIFILFLLYRKVGQRVSEKTYKLLTYILLAVSIAAIVALLIYVNPYSIRVDRWSATSFFWDAAFRGDYPYGVHTHVSETNFPSPFPAWQIINLPFYILGDVGIGLICFLLLVFFSLRTYFGPSYSKIFVFFALLLISPAYWWEVVVRSDSMSNAFLVFAFILWFTTKKYTLNTNFLLSILCCGIFASTRLSAILPISLFLFPFYIQLSWKRKILFPLGILCVIALFFAPFIFWDTSNRVFFSRNPFMSQTSIGSNYVLVVMIFFAIYLALKWKNMLQFFQHTSIFIFLFILFSQISLVFTHGISQSFFEDGLYDISYFSLGLAYTIISIADSSKSVVRER